MFGGSRLEKRRTPTEYDSRARSRRLLLARQPTTTTHRPVHLEQRQRVATTVTEKLFPDPNLDRVRELPFDDLREGSEGGHSIGHAGQILIANRGHQRGSNVLERKGPEKITVIDMRLGDRQQVDQSIDDSIEFFGQIGNVGGEIGQTQLLIIAVGENRGVIARQDLDQLARDGLPRILTPACQAFEMLGLPIIGR